MASLLSIRPEDITGDSFERDLLSPSITAAGEPDDPLFIELAHLHTELENTLATMRAHMRRIFRAIIRGEHSTYTAVAEDVGCAPVTVSKALKNPAFKRCLALNERILTLHKAPAEVQRLQMAWRIAKRNEIDHPRISLAALDLINKQTGVYRPDDLAAEGVKVVIANFHISTPEQLVKTTQSAPSPVIEGEFKRVTVETDSP